jgi:uncharacterized FlaG/YvyC family protein
MEQSEIPLVIPYYYNYRDLIDFLKQERIQDFKKIIILNFTEQEVDLSFNNSVEQRLIRKNYGPRYALYSMRLRSDLPQYYFVSDPDILLNKELPKNFINIMIAISEMYNTGKVGVALDISYEIDERITFRRRILGTNEFKTYNVVEWESQYWEKQLNQQKFNMPIFEAEVDTTFCLINQRYFSYEHNLTALRVGGEFTSIHLPWLKNYVEDSKYLEKAVYSSWKNDVEKIDLEQLIDSNQNLLNENENLKYENEKLNNFIKQIQKSIYFKVTRKIKGIVIHIKKKTKTEVKKF